MIKPGAICPRLYLLLRPDLSIEYLFQKKLLRSIDKKKLYGFLNGRQTNIFNNRYSF